jgi:hypothetical protein
MLHWVIIENCFIFSSKRETPLRPNNILRRHHYPLLDRLKIPSAVFMRSSWIDVPMVIRQKRLGRADISTTMKYTHSVSEEEHRVSEQSAQIHPSCLPLMLLTG